MLWNMWARPITPDWDKVEDSLPVELFELSADPFPVSGLTDELGPITDGAVVDAVAVAAGTMMNLRGEFVATRFCRIPLATLSFSNLFGILFLCFHLYCSPQ